MGDYRNPKPLPCPWRCGRPVSEVYGTVYHDCNAFYGSSLSTTLEEWNNRKGSKMGKRMTDAEHEAYHAKLTDKIRGEALEEAAALMEDYQAVSNKDRADAIRALKEQP